ncbi:NEL-type E3 ubiquitin ligase domain-containing protein [Pseudomonas sp. EA_65y_Pfl1_P120]|uniref:NEL-type E3 ubiquitin ligase domain-containing protein n=1 Tax=Pseudomonas sp. EA_65y_Pfl1_P120 TaxID=3088693 RepID=UPI0030DC8A29
MTHRTIDPPTRPVQDEHSPHGRLIKDNTPGWYTDAQDQRKTELASLELNIPDWYKKAPAAARDRMSAIHLRSRTSLNQLDQMFSELKGPAEYAEPLLVAAIEKTFGQRLDTRKAFYARKLTQLECESAPREVSTSYASTLAPQFYFYKGISLLEAALNNFTSQEASDPGCEDCHLITYYNFYQYPSDKLHSPGNVQSLPVRIKSHEFAKLCRELDLGNSYYECVRTFLNNHIRTTTTPAGVGKLYSTLITSHRNQLKLAAEIALMKGDIRADHHQLINDLLIDQADRKWDGEVVKFSPLRLLNCVIENILVIGPVVWRTNVRNAALVPRPCLVYIPGDPLHPLKVYDHVAAFTDELTTRLCHVEYRTFFSQFVPLADQDGFFTQLKALLDPGAVYAHDQDFAPAQKSRIHRQGTYASPWRDVWMDCAMQRIRLIMSNASTSVVSTQDVDDRVYKAWLWSFGSKALDILNLASFVVPFLGEVMLVVAAAQVLYEVGEGIDAWSQDDVQAVWAHFSAVGFNLAGLALPKVLETAKNTAFIKRLVHVERGGRPRLYDFQPRSYLHQIALPDGQRPNALGLYVHEAGLYLPANGGGHYKVKASGTDNEFRFVHPEGDARYAPRVRHNGEGAWVHEFEQPSTWDRQTLLRRMGHTVDHLSDSQLEQARAISGVTDDELRRVFIEHRPPAPLLKDMLRRFECAGKYQSFIDRLSHSDPWFFSQVDWFTQVQLLLECGMWPESRVLVALDAEGNQVWCSAVPSDSSSVVTLGHEELESGRLFSSFREQLTEPEIRHLLGEKKMTQEAISMLFLRTRDVSSETSPSANEELDDEDTDPLMQYLRTHYARVVRYRDCLLEAAYGTKGKLFNREISAGDVSSDANVKLIQRDFPGLPKLAAEEIVSHANSQELTSMQTGSRLPLRLAEEARVYWQKARVMRAHADLLFDNQLTLDVVRLALHKMASLPGLLEGVSVELREGAYDGPLLDRVGDTSAPRQLRLIHTDLKEWKLCSGPEKVEYWRSDEGAFFNALWMASSGKFTGWAEFNRAAQRLKMQIAQQPLSELASRRALGLKAIKPGFKSPMRLADGRIGYPLSPVGGAGERPSVCRMKAMALYPSKSMTEVEVMLDLQGAGDAVLLARLTQLEAELADLDTALGSWQQEGGSGYASARRRVSGTIKAAWRRSSAQALAGDQTPIGHVLDLSHEVIGELPAITANMDHVGSLVLRRMALSDSSLPFLNAFGGLRWLDMRENNLTQLPDFANGGAGLTKLYLSRNDIQMTESSRLRLEGMQSLKILNLSDNRRLGWQADLRRLRNLNQLYLSDTGTETFPVGAEQLPQLARVDLHTNRITTLPEYAFQHPDRIIVHDNPLSAATLARLGEPFNAAHLGEHITVDEARGLWLGALSASESARRGGIWDELRANPESAAFFTVVSDTTRSAEFNSDVTRPVLAQRVWNMLEAASESQAIRESLFAAADDRVTCGDGSSVEFMNLESELLGARALELAGVESEEGALVSTGRKLFRLALVDAIAERDVAARGPGFTEQVEVILAYRTRLAVSLDLPVQSRDMLFAQQAAVSQADIDNAGAEVQREMRHAAKEADFFIGRLFWDKHLRTRYPQELEALMKPDLVLIDEKSTALFDISDLQGEQDAAVDPATRALWQTKHDEAVGRLARLLSMRRDQILVNGSMQSVFFERELKQLGAERRALEQRALHTLTRRVFNNVAASGGTAL